jgi:hypothetical protein
MRRIAGPRSLSLLLVALVAAFWAPAPAAAADGQTWAVHTSLVSTWFDPAESIQGTPPFMVLSATHDALVLIHERAMFGPIWDFAFLHGVGARVEEPGLGLLSGYGFSGPYEDVKLKGR